MSDSATMKFNYRFIFPANANESAKQDEFTLEFNSEHMALQELEVKEPPAWARLENGQCKNCPLKKETTPYCPIAKNMAALLNRYAAHKSFTKLRAEVETKERSYSRELSLQEAMHSAFGLIMATSGCPHMNFLRPMARFHLPFATYEETVIRSVSFYLLKQYFIKKRGGTPDFDLQKMESLYQEVQVVNLGFVNRIRSIIKADAAPNSIVILDGYSQLLTMQLMQKLDQFEPWFA